ncbi:DUF642 domain-containing protein [Rubritalea marina]|uniref:DUF642 domain-containing protein n=1 Tax=Rubritalea marina TaxID=361055 RepID=UPI000362386D|nr:DUF642 domain-containing protein [Rubritalea marina]
MIKQFTRAALLCFSCIGVASGDTASDLAAVAALGDLTTAPAIYGIADENDVSVLIDAQAATSTTLSPGDNKGIYMDGLTYDGSSTRIYARVKIPAGASAANKVPAIVYVHGGGGTAYKNAVTAWEAKGYASISIATEGQVDTKDTNFTQINTGWNQHNMAGPIRPGIYGDSANAIEEQWMYHAVSGAVLANSLMRSLDFVDASKVGIVGTSWGGVITSTTMGVDNRFAFAIPIYGCGHLYDSLNFYGTNLGANDTYRNVWDPILRLANFTQPSLWLSYPQETNFQLDCLVYSFHEVGGTAVMSLPDNLGHGDTIGWITESAFDFADSVVATAAPWATQVSKNVLGSTATVVFQSTRPLTGATLLSTTDWGTTPNYSDATDVTWTSTVLTAPSDNLDGTYTVTATLPAGTRAWFVNATDGSGTPPFGDAVISSDYTEVISVNAVTADLSIDHVISNTQTQSGITLSYSYPHNIDMTAATISGESHVGAFSVLTSFPLVQNNDPDDAGTNDTINVQFDNSTAGLAVGQSATATLNIQYENVDQSISTTSLAITATVVENQEVVYDSTSDWSAQTVNSYDDATIRNNAVVTTDASGILGPNLVTDGSFEAYGTASIQALDAGASALSPWVIGGDGLTLVDTFNTGNYTTEAADGDQFVALQSFTNTGTGTLTQTIATTAGKTYRLSFSYGAVDFSARSTTLEYSIGSLNRSVNFTSDANDIGWTSETFDFVAEAGTSTTLTFTGDYFNGFWGGVLDNVVVQEVQDIAAFVLTVGDEASPSTATLNVTNNVEVTSSLLLGAGTGSGVVNHSSGVLTTPSLLINSSNTGEPSTYNLTGGTLSLTEAASFQIGLNSSLVVQGGTASKVYNSSSTTMDIGALGSGSRVEVLSGAFQIMNGVVGTNVATIHADLHLSGGDIDVTGYIWQYGDITINGDDADVDLGGMIALGGPSLSFVFDSSGISSLDFANWVDASLFSTITVDGSDYTGGAQSFNLINATGGVLGDPVSVTPSGFSEHGYTATVSQTSTVLSVAIVRNSFGVWAESEGLSGAEIDITADPDNDGQSNLYEYAFNGDPNVADPGVFPMAFDAGKVTLTRREGSAAGLIYTVQESSTLLSNDWADINSGITTTVLSTDGDFETVEITPDLGNWGASEKFLRIKVDFNP